MLHKNKYGIWKYSPTITGGMNNDDKDFKSALDSRPRFALMDKLIDLKSYHIEYYKDDNGKTRKRRVRNQRDTDLYEGVSDALYSLGIYK